MAAFAAAVKIDTFAYLPVQDFGNAYSTFVAQNYGAGEKERIRKGTRQAFAISGVFSLIISALVYAGAPYLMRIFIRKSETEVLAAISTVSSHRGSLLYRHRIPFLLYGYYRAIKQAEMSLVLTVISLGLRVVLAYVLSV